MRIASRLALLIVCALFATHRADAQATPFGTGCSGLFPEAQIGFAGSTTPGKNAQLFLTGGPPNTAVVLLVGTSDEQMPTGAPLPLDLSFVPGIHPGCQLYTSADLPSPHRRAPGPAIARPRG